MTAENLFLSSLFHHITGASFLGLILTVPWLNLYVHGTYITSAHAHLALFGAMGFLVLGGCYYILSRGTEPMRKPYWFAVIGVILLNLGLVSLSFALLMAGFLQAYLWRYLGLEFMEVRLLLQPYLILRVLGGGIFTLGDLILSWRLIKAWWETR